MRFGTFRPSHPSYQSRLIIRLRENCQKRPRTIPMSATLTVFEPSLLSDRQCSQSLEWYTTTFFEGYKPTKVLFENLGPFYLSYQNRLSIPPSATLSMTASENIHLTSDLAFLRDFAVPRFLVPSESYI